MEGRAIMPIARMPDNTLTLTPSMPHMPFRRIRNLSGLYSVR